MKQKTSEVVTRAHEIDGKEDAHLLKEAKKIVEAIGKMFAPMCEVVLHDLTRPHQSIIAIETPLSGRRKGDATTELGLARIQDPHFPDVLLNYPNQFPDGRPAKSTSIGIKNRDGHFIAAICLNLDVSLFSSMQSVLHQLISSDETKLPVNESLRARSAVDIRGAIKGFAASHNTQPRALGISQRRDLIQGLSQDGVLQIRGATSVVADSLGISRASVYNVLKPSPAKIKRPPRARPSSA